MKLFKFNWILQQLRNTINSIAFYPALIAVVYLVISFLMVDLDFSETGKAIKSNLTWLKLKDADTARAIVSVIATGILSLTIFSFTMVMIVLNQAASQMSNRVLDKLIGNRLQQIILGIYIGTIIYSLFLLSTIRDVDEGVHVPSLSTYLLILFAIINIFLFIFFLHYITQSIKYNIIIRRIKKQTYNVMKSSCRLTSSPKQELLETGMPVLSGKTGIFDGFNKKALVELACKNDIVISFMHPIGTYVLQQSMVASCNNNGTGNLSKLKEEISSYIFVEEDSTVQRNYYHGLNQLTEIAIKALSPGINDPGTAKESLRSLTDLVSYRLLYHPNNTIKDDNGQIRIITIEKSIDELILQTIVPIWDYGKNDRLVQKEMIYLLGCLQSVQYNKIVDRLLIKVHEQSQKGSYEN